MAKDPSSIRTYKKGGRTIFHDDLNAFGAAAVKVSTIGEGFTEDEGVSQNAKLQRGTSPVVIVDPTEDIPPYSIFGIRGAGNVDRGPITVRIQQQGPSLSTTGSPLTLYTNKDYELKLGEEGYAYPLVTGERYFITYAGSAIPDIGYPCGVETGSYIISSEFSGLVCVSENDTVDLDGGTFSGVWVTLAQQGTLFGIASTGITPYNVLTNTLGKGKVTIHLRDTSAALTVSEAFDPKLTGTVGALDFFELDVRNASGTIAEGEPVILHSVAGVGMLAVSTTGSSPWIGWVTQNIPGAETQMSGAPGSKPGTTVGTNIRLEYLLPDAVITDRAFSNLLDDASAIVEITAFNTCETQIDLDQRVQGKTIFGDFYVDVVCCPP